MATGRKIALITGASGAIGSATVKRFLEAGFHVVGADREPSAVTGQDYCHVQVDLQDDRAVRKAFDQALSGTLQHVVSIAGGALPKEPPTQDDPMQVDLETFRSSIEVNLTSHFSLVQATLPRLRGLAGDRTITLTSSFNALTGWGMPAYSAAKAGLIGMMHALTAPLGREGIRINVVAPGTVRTPRTERIWSHDQDHFPALERSTALLRLGTPDDVAQTYLALATMMSHVTGQVLVVDGGQMVKRSV